MRLVVFAMLVMTIAGSACSSSSTCKTAACLDGGGATGGGTSGTGGRAGGTGGGTAGTSGSGGSAGGTTGGTGGGAGNGGRGGSGAAGSPGGQGGGGTGGGAGDGGAGGTAGGGGAGGAAGAGGVAGGGGTCGEPVSCEGYDTGGDANVTAMITCLSPSSATANAGFTLAIFGHHLATSVGSNAIVTIGNGAPLNGVPASACHLNVTVPASVVASPGQLHVVVSPGGRVQDSAPATLTVQ